MLIVAIAMMAFLLLPLITNRLRLPDIIGILIAGIIVGPHGIGLLERDETIQLLGTVGLLYLVFLAGLEVDLADLSRKRGRAIAFGVLTFLVPQIIGTIGGMLFFGFGVATSVLLGSVFSSHSFLALLIAKRLGLTNREMTVAVIGGTVITDTLALLVLAVVAQSRSGTFGPLFLIQLLLQAGVFAGAVVFGLPLLGRWFFRHVHDGGAQFAFMMTVLFACGFIAHLVGLEPIIGAFLAGLAMNRLVPHHGVLANRAFFIGNTIFVPFFLLSVGMLIDLRMVVSDIRTIEMAIFMTVTVTVCKFAAAWLMRQFFGYGRADAVVAWGLSLPQAATTLAVVLVGHELGLFDDAILNATIVMVLVTCVLGPILVERAGRQIASDEPAAGPSDSEATLGQFQRILIPLVNPQSSDNLLDFANALHRPLNNEPLLPLSVAEHHSQVAMSEKLLESSVIHLAAAEVPVSAEIRVDPNPVNGILRAQEELRATCLVVGWSGPEANWQRYFHLDRGIIDELIADSLSQLFVVRLTEPLPVIEKVVLAIPALAHGEAGFTSLISDCKLLTKRLSANMTVVGPEIDHPAVTAACQAGPTCTIELQPGHYHLEGDIDDVLDQHCLLIIVGCREESVSWNSAWHRAATAVAHRRQDLSLAIAYPAMREWDRDSRTFMAQPAGLPGILHRARITTGTAAEDIKALVRTGLPERFPDSPLLIQRLLDSLSALNNQVALVHVSTTGVSQPELAIVLAKEPVEHESLALRIMLVLVNPIGTPAKHHLDNLAAIAHVFANAQQVEAMLSASSEQAVRAAMQSGDRDA